MYEKIDGWDFVARFETGLGGQYSANFSRGALWALFSYLEDLERDTGEQQQLDVIALCCEFTEYEDDANYAGQHGLDVDELAGDERYAERIKIEGGAGFILRAG